MAEFDPMAAQTVFATAQRIRELERQTLPPQFDEQETADRLDAAQAYAGESEQHFTHYCEEMVRSSYRANQDIRRVQNELWQIYQEEEPKTYANKEDWQSRVVVPKPHSAVQFAKAQVRKAFTPQFLSIQSERSEAVADFWTKLMRIQLDRSHANFVIRYLDAVEMSFAIGQSMEMIPYWVSGKGLEYALVEPWKIHRDPDANGRDPQSGMYWIHEEYQDLWTLKQGEANGQYINVGRVQEQSHNPANPEMDKENEAFRRKMIWDRNQFRKSALVREFWGTILSPRGEYLLEGTYTVAGSRVIALPEPSPYQHLRWPGISFSPLPHLLRYEGRAILHGVRTLWYFMCSLLTLHNDNLNWVVNPMTEINRSALIDEDDIDVYPGKTYVTRETMNGQQAVRTVDRRFITGEILANLQYADSLFQTGSFVNATVQGLPGYRSEITAREQAQHLDQSLTVFGSMGVNLEDGALFAIEAGRETILANMTFEELQQFMSDEDLQVLMDPAVSHANLGLNQDIPIPQLNGHFSVSGLSALIENMEVLRNLNESVLPMSLSPLYARYFKHYNVAKSQIRRLNLQDEDVLITEKEAEQVDQEQKQQMADASQQQQALLQAQQQAEQQKMALEGQKLQLEARKMEIEQQKLAMQAEIDQAKLEGERLNLQEQQALMDGEIQKVEAEIERVQAEIERVRTQGDVMLAQLQLQREKAQLAEREAEQRMRLAAAAAQQKAAQSKNGSKA